MRGPFGGGLKGEPKRTAPPSDAQRLELFFPYPTSHDLLETTDSFVLLVCRGEPYSWTSFPPPPARGVRLNQPDKGKSEQVPLSL